MIYGLRLGGGNGKVTLLYYFLLSSTRWVFFIKQVWLHTFAHFVHFAVRSTALAF